MNDMIMFKYSFFLHGYFNYKLKYNINHWNKQIDDNPFTAPEIFWKPLFRSFNETLIIVYIL